VTEWLLEVEELIMLLLLFERVRQMACAYEEALSPICAAASVLPAKALPPHGPSPDVHDRNHDEQPLARPFDGQVGIGREEGSVALAASDAPELG